MLHKTVFAFISLFLTSSKRENNWFDHLSDLFLASLWFLDNTQNKINLIQNMLVSYSIFPGGPIGWRLLEILPMQGIINSHSNWHFVLLFIFLCIISKARLYLTTFKLINILSYFPCLSLFFFNLWSRVHHPLILPSLFMVRPAPSPIWCKTAFFRYFCLPILPHIL